MSTDRFNFNAKPGEPGFREVKKNKFGHTVLTDNDEEQLESDNVSFTLDPSTGTPRADLSLWDTSIMRDLAQKLNLPLDDNGIEVTELVPEEPNSHQITDKDMDDLLQDIEEEEDYRHTTVPSSVNSLPESNLTSPDNRVRKVAGNTFKNADLRTTKACTDESCAATLPTNAKFCSTCGKLQKVTAFCIECGRKFNEREKFCADCGCVRE